MLVHVACTWDGEALAGGVDVCMVGTLCCLLVWQVLRWWRCPAGPVSFLVGCCGFIGIDGLLPM